MASYERNDMDFVLELGEQMEEYKKQDYSDLVFFCIGTDKVTGDSFGPLVGYRLQQFLKELAYPRNVLVVGDLKQPVSISNVQEKLEYLYSICQKPYIIAIDAAVSSKERIGTLVLSKEGIKVGKGLHKNMIQIGNMSIKGVVAKDYKIPKVNFTILQNTPLHLVMELAENTASGIYKVIKYY